MGTQVLFKVLNIVIVISVLAVSTLLTSLLTLNTSSTCCGACLGSLTRLSSPVTWGSELEDEGLCCVWIDLTASVC